VEKKIESGGIIKMQISKEGISLIKKFEGCPTETIDGKTMAVSYRCAANKPTIGFGSLHLIDGTPVKDDMKISLEEAEELLAKELKTYENYINEMVKVDIDQNQFSALVCWCFNIGQNGAKSSTAIRVLNEKKFERVPAAMKMWNKITVDGERKTSEGLVRRREAEALLFESKDWTKI
jgi:GH24 family phage-related lysozyme (muramidase)